MTTSMNISQFLPVAETLFSKIKALTSDGVGITRDAYGAGEAAAFDFLRDFALQEGLATSTDRAGNLHIHLPQTDPAGPSIWCGSHLDSVPQGGNYDGLAGVIAALICLLAQKDNTSAGALPMQVVGFRGEESVWFGKTYLGSNALFGKLSPEDLQLKHRDTGETLASLMKAVGADIEAISAQECLVDKHNIKAYLELHIEQGPVMVAKNLPVGVVSAIRGNIRHNRIRCIGEAGHSGAVPRWLRKDAMFAVADLIMRLDEHWRVLLERGTDLVVTTGIVTTDPKEHSITRIPGQVSLSFDVRSRSDDTLEAFYQLMRAECNAVSRERAVQFEFDRRIKSEPAIMDEHIRTLLSKACAENGILHEDIPSGAGHDASIFANVGVPSGMLFVKNQNGSHNPFEEMDIGDFMLGVQALYATITRLSQGGVYGTRIDN